MILSGMFGAGSDGGSIVYSPTWANVSMLLNAAGSDASTTITDETGNTTWTANGDLQVDTSLGVNALQFDGSGDYGALSGAVPSALQIESSSNFVIDFVVRTNSTSTQAIVGNLNDASGAGAYWIILNSTYLGAHTVQFGSPGGTHRFGNIAFPLNALTNVTIVRNGSDLHCFLNGTRLTTTTGGNPTSSISNWTANYTVPYLLGMSYHTTLGYTRYPLSGWIQALRIAKGQSGPVSDFTPSAPPWPTS